MTLGTSPLLPDLGRCVGKTDPAEVLVTGWLPNHDGTYAVTAHWPGVHRFYTLTSEAHGPHLFTESVRQALALLTHAAFDIPVSYRLGWERFTSTVASGALRTGADTAAVRLVVAYEPITRRRSGTTHLSASVTAELGESLLGSARVRYTAYPPAIYDRLRGRYADAGQACARALPVPSPVAPSLTGRRRPSDVVLATGDGPRSWNLRIDTGHPVLFDHPHDHVPGMVLLEACGQAAVSAARPHPTTPVAFDTTFSRYVELDRPCRVVAEDTAPAGQDRGLRHIRVTGSQDGRQAFSSTVTLQSVTTPLATGSVTV
ncbi:ScbA/BarX family gamma-butyrolactone biosynthesis protein [Streptomyces fenghuangensis]|uniref:ScbA/BarX family gamma-butyrolactone biosynthesis protein n=1 Tax=Streptomyces chitinivorans TaxID=1257027 RepID=A0ABW7HXD9_9ACTN|nr:MULTISPECIES: ScbA/BarX family gamma-butyrolactone biosynthesis protein [Streptomyces]MCG3040414.1 gamma-butyrolactone biosynthesis enzyme [Streptomyces sp. ICN903]MDH2410429.1 ScbA/BarX family gamma-butyrolactone biosynthesis protein [Streptomyces chitinivorans]